MSDEWISAVEALRLATAVGNAFSAPRAICSRAHAGLIKATAARFFINSTFKDDVELPNRFWWAGGEAALVQNWQTGDFETWIDRKIHLRAFGVRFARSGIEVLIGSPITSSNVPVFSTNKSGRPRAGYWDDLLIEMCRLIYVGDLKPTRQAEIEAAMKEWAVGVGQDVSDSAIRQRARKLWYAVFAEGKN